MLTVFVDRFKFNDDGFPTESSKEQEKTEKMVRDEYEKFLATCDSEMEQPDPRLTPKLNMADHSHYLINSLDKLGSGYSGLDSSRTWMCYWALHSLRLMNCDIPSDVEKRVIAFLETCKVVDSGYAGGPGQLPHLATTYAAVMSLITLSSDDALARIDRDALRKFILKMKNCDGSFRLHEGGETDIRGAYCALAVASITNILDDELTANTADWITSCQTYEGGFGSNGPCEAHGGYTFCAMAALTILDKTNRAYLPSLLKWLVNKQMIYEGGFQGRSNKLVDGCYSYWQAATFPIIEYTLEKDNHWKNGFDNNLELFDWKALQAYILIGCQDPAGGLRDKPDKPRDLYHTCYVLSGLSIAQEYSNTDDPNVGGPTNCLNRVNSIYNICTEQEKRAVKYFSSAEDNV